MRRFGLTLIGSLALVLTIGFGVSAATNGQGLGAVGRSKSDPGANVNGATRKVHKEFTATPFAFDPGHTGFVAGAWLKHLGLPQSTAASMAPTVPTRLSRGGSAFAASPPSRIRARPPSRAT